MLHLSIWIEILGQPNPILNATKCLFVYAICMYAHAHARHLLCPLTRTVPTNSPRSCPPYSPFGTCSPPPLPPPTFPHLLLLLFILFYFLCYCWRGILGMWPFYFEFIFCFLSKNGREWMTSTLPPPPCYFVEHRYVYISNIVFHLLRLNVASI